MSLHPDPIGPISEEMARVARAAFRKGNLCLRLRDSLGTSMIVVRVLLDLSAIVLLMPPEPFPCVTRLNLKCYSRPASSNRHRSFVRSTPSAQALKERIRKGSVRLDYIEHALSDVQKPLYSICLLLLQ